MACYLIVGCNEEGTSIPFSFCFIHNDDSLNLKEYLLKFYESVLVYSQIKIMNTLFMIDCAPLERRSIEDVKLIYPGY